MASVVFFRAVNVGGHQKFQPGKLAAALAEFGVVNLGAAGTFVVREAVSQTQLRAAILARLPFAPELMICPARDVLALARGGNFPGHDSRPELTRTTVASPSPPYVGGRRGPGRGGFEFAGRPLSPALSPLVPRGEREKMRTRSAPVQGEWFREAPVEKDFDRFVSVLSSVPRALPPLPIEHPGGGKWEVRIVAITGRFALSLRRPGQTYSNAVVEKWLGLRATTRHWNTIEAICRVLEKHSPVRP